MINKSVTHKSKDRQTDGQISGNLQGSKPNKNDLQFSLNMIYLYIRKERHVMKMLLNTYVNLREMIVYFNTGNKNPNNNFIASVIIFFLFVKMLLSTVYDKMYKACFCFAKNKNVLLFYDSLI